MLMIIAMMVFAAQDGISKHLAQNYPIIFITMVRYWFFGAFVIVLSARRPGGLRAVTRTAYPLLQCFRGALLALEICVMVTAFVMLGLVESHAVFAAYPLMVAALSGPVLGERVGWRRWLAIGVGFAGVLMILRPGLHVVDPAALIALVAAIMFALYHLATRYVSRVDGGATSFFYTGVGGAATMTLIGPFFWTSLEGWDNFWMGLLCITGMSGHYLLIKALEAAETTTIQPFAYLQLMFASIIGVTVFAETLDDWIIAGAALIVAAGLFTLWRERIARTRAT